MERQTITVDIAPGNNQIQRLKSSQGDIGRPLGVYITQNGVALDCSAYTADLYILKPDGNYFTATATVDATEHNLITWETAKQETPVAGDCAAQIRILSNGDDVGTARFVEYVEASPGFVGESSESVVESLMEYVRQAAASAETASGAASSATGSASAASGSASAAASSASAAAGSASSAHTDAETASQAAQTAQDVADSIPEDYSTLSNDVSGLKSAFEQFDANVITESAGPAPIVSIADGADGMPMRKVDVAIEPVQDLHGYDYPWPAGSSVNKLPPLVDGTYTGNGITVVVKDGIATMSGTTTASGNAVIIPFVEEFTVPENSYIHALNSNANGGISLSFELSSSVSTTAVSLAPNPANRIFAIPNERYGVKWDRLRLYIGDNTTVSGTISPMVCLTNAATDYTPYSNICPISGWTGAKVTRAGKNLFNIGLVNTSTGRLTVDGTTISKRDSGYSVDVFSGGQGSAAVSTKVYLLKAGTYTISGIYVGTGSLNVYKLGDDAKAYGDRISYINESTTSRSFTLEKDYYITLRYSSQPACTVTDLQIEPGSTATAYEPYQGQTYEVTFPSETGTVYGGTLDVASGKLTVTHYYVNLSNASNISYHTGTVPSLWLAYQSGKAGDASSSLNAISNMYPVGGNAYPKVVYYGSEIDIYDDRFTDDTTARSLLADFLCVYKLYTPVVVENIDQATIQTLLGQNNIWADTGAVNVEYPADTKMYIDNKITEAIAAALNA